MTEGKWIASTTIKCPHCGLENNVLVYTEELRKTIPYFCDVEQGGCAEQFAYRVGIEVEVDIYTLQKVEQE